MCFVLLPITAHLFSPRNLSEEQGFTKNPDKVSIPSLAVNRIATGPYWSQAYSRKQSNQKKTTGGIHSTVAARWTTSQ